MKAIETRYNGYRFRSRLEARYAVFFDVLGVRYEYEKQGYVLDSSGTYLPDFYLPDYDVWVEIKGQINSEDDLAKVSELATSSGKTAFAAIGGVGEDDWRQFGETHWFDKMPWTLVANTSASTTLYKHDYGLPGDQFACPVCGMENVHFKNPVYHDGEDSHKAWAGRGDAIRIPMWCEEGCSWTLIMGFHKGFTFVHIEDVMKYAKFELALAGYSYENLGQAVRASRSARFEFGETPQF